MFYSEVKYAKNSQTFENLRQRPSIAITKYGFVQNSHDLVAIAKVATLFPFFFKGRIKYFSILLSLVF